MQPALMTGEGVVNRQIVKLQSFIEISHISLCFGIKFPKLVYFRPSIWWYSRNKRICLNPTRIFGLCFIGNGFCAKKKIENTNWHMSSSEPVYLPEFTEISCISRFKYISKAYSMSKLNNICMLSPNTKQLQVQIEKKGKNKSHEEIFYQMKVFLSFRSVVRIVFCKSARCP